MGTIRDVTGSGLASDYVQALLDALTGLYEKDDQDTILRKLYETLAIELALTDRRIQAVKNDNYIDISVVDEVVTRDQSTEDKLVFENAYRLNSIRINPSTTTQVDFVQLLTGDSIALLSYIPSDISSILIYDNQAATRAPVATAISFDTATNILSFTPVTKDGFYVIEYLETGNVLPQAERISLPDGLFNVGYGKAPYGISPYGG